MPDEHDEVGLAWHETCLMCERAVQQYIFFLQSPQQQAMLDAGGRAVV